MKNMMKMVAFGLLVSSMAQVDARIIPKNKEELGRVLKRAEVFVRDEIGEIFTKAQSFDAVRKLNSLHKCAPYFPGTWPLNKVHREHVRQLFEGYNLPGYEKVPACIFNQNEGIFGSHPLADWLQLSGAVLCKWVPAFLIVRGVVRKMTKKKKHKKRSVQCDGCASHS